MLDLYTLRFFLDVSVYTWLQSVIQNNCHCARVKGSAFIALFFYNFVLNYFRNVD